MLRYHVVVRGPYNGAVYLCCPHAHIFRFLAERCRARRARTYLGTMWDTAAVESYRMGVCS